MDYGLWYQRDKDFSITVYTKANWEGDLDDWKNTSGGDLFLGEFIVSCLRKKQASIYLSIANA